jgi:hypothetical protein
LRQAPAIGDIAAEAAWVGIFGLAEFSEISVEWIKQSSVKYFWDRLVIAYKKISFAVLNETITAFEFWLLETNFCYPFTLAHIVKSRRG